MTRATLALLALLFGCLRVSLPRVDLVGRATHSSTGPAVRGEARLVWEAPLPPRPPDPDRRPSVAPEPRSPCPSAALCAWEDVAARRALAEIVGGVR